MKGQICLLSHSAATLNMREQNILKQYLNGFLWFLSIWFHIDPNIFVFYLNFSRILIIFELLSAHLCFAESYFLPQKHVLSLDGPVVTASGFKDELAVVSHVSDCLPSNDQVLFQLFIVCVVFSECWLVQGSTWGLILVQFRTNTFEKAITKNAQVHDDINVKSFLDKIVNYLLAEDTVTLARLMVWICYLFMIAIC